MAQRNASREASGALSRTLSNALAAPVGLRLPCSQLRMVSSDTSMRRENSSCVSPRRFRTRCANAAASWAEAASSSRCCASRSASEVP